MSDFDINDLIKIKPPNNEPVSDLNNNTLDESNLVNEKNETQENVKQITIDQDNLEDIIKDMLEWNEQAYVEEESYEVESNTSDIDKSEEEGDSETLICNIDVYSLLNKFLSISNLNNQMANIEANQSDLNEKYNELSVKIELSNNSKPRYTYRGQTKIYY